MIDFISDNWGTIIVGLFVSAIVYAIISRMVKQKKAGKPVLCDGGCGGCSGACNSCSSSLNSLSNDNTQYPT